MCKPARFLLLSVISISASSDHPHTLHTMGSTGDVEMAGLRQPTLHTGARTTSRLRRSRSLPEDLHLDRNLQSTHVAHEAQAPTLPSNVPASTEAVEVDQVDQLATAAKTTELHGSTQSLILSNPNSDLENILFAPTWAESGPPTVVPASEDTDYDYLEKVKEICEGISPDLYDDLLEKHFQEGHGEVFLISNEETRLILRKSNHYGSEWENLESEFFLKHGIMPNVEQIVKRSTPELSILRNLVISATQDNPHVLIVEGIDRNGAQMLGRAFDINPRFYVQHLGTWQSRLDIPHQRALEVLSQKFESFVKQRNEVPSHAEGDVPKPSLSYAMNGNLDTFITTDGAEALDPWPGSGTGGIDWGFESVLLYPRATCYQVSPYSCKVHFIRLGCLPSADISPS
jgi:hypothetical protein